MKEFVKKNLASGKLLRKIVDFFHFMYLAFANHIVSNVPFYFIRTFIYRYGYFMKIGKNSHIQMGLRVYAPWKIKIGNNCAIGNDCFLDGRRGIIIGNNVDIASNVKILTLGHDLDDEWYKTVGKQVIIENNVSVFTAASILPGITLAEGSVVALGSILTKNTDKWTVYAGNPAKPVKKRQISNLKYTSNYKRYFH